MRVGGWRVWAWWSILAVLAAATIASARTLTWPVPGVSLCLGLAAIVGAARASRSARLILVYLAAIALTLAGYEAYLWHREAAGPETHWEGDYESLFHSDDLLGYSAQKDAAVTSAQITNGKRLYDIVYHTDAAGLRIEPPHRPEVDGCVLFLGDSTTFGHGMKDEQTLPYRVGIRTGGRFEVKNFSFLGWGPHQLLAALETGLVDKSIHCLPSFAIYEALCSHVERVAGRALWDQHGPRYVLAARGGIERIGNFDDPENRPRLRFLEKSLIYQASFGNRRAVKPMDVELFTRVVVRIRELLEERGATFRVLLWDDPELKEECTSVRGELTNRGIEIIDISSILPEYATDPAAVAISPDDLHPSARSNDRLAEYVARELLPPAAASSPGFAHKR